MFLLNNFYIVESPLQALCALEVSLTRKDEKHGIVVKLAGKNRSLNNKQIIYIINKRKWDYKVIINDISSINPLATHFKRKRLLVELKNKLAGRVERLYIGEFRSSFMHMVRVAVDSNKEFLLDDGAATVKIMNTYLSKSLYCPYDTFYPSDILRKVVFKFIYKEFPCSLLLNRKLDLITAFSGLCSNSANYINFKNVKLLMGRGRKENKSLVFYYGSKYSEVGIVSREYELSFLNEIKLFYQQKNITVVYFAHRDESNEKLAIIEKDIFSKVVTPELPAEVYLLENEFLPFEVAAAYSSVINNVKVIFPDMSLRSFRLNPKRIGVKWREDIELIYAYYKSVNIKIEF